MERLYSILEIMKIKDIVRFHSETTTPIPDVVYHLYSLPSFDNNQTREELLGQDIQSNKFTVPNRCILFNKLNVRFKRIWRIDSDEDHKIASTEFLPLIIDENKVDFDYCFYLLASPAITDYLCGQNANTSGSHKRIDPTNFFNIGIKLPPLAQQYEIGKLLSSLDTKIKLNRQINQNLEAMAKQLYDYWFVQFDFPNEEGKPYKSSGGKMVWNEKLKREIPSCFNIANMEKLCKFRNGINYSKDETGNDFQIVNVRNISSSKILLDGEDFDTITVPMTKAENYLLKSEDIIIARSGCPGSTRLLISPTNTLFCGFIICCTPHNSSMRNYLTYCLKQLEGTNATTSGGSILQNVSQDTLKGLLIVVPNKQIIDKFNETIELIFTRILNCLKETKALTKQRDELLPLLMNGQVSVNSDLSVYKKRRGKVPSSILNDVSDI